MGHFLSLDVSVVYMHRDQIITHFYKWAVHKTRHHSKGSGRGFSNEAYLAKVLTKGEGGGPQIVFKIYDVFYE